MNERQHHLNESSSARLGRSQQLEILPSPNSKQTQSLGADFSDGRIALAPIFLIRAEILTSALFLSYIMWRSNFTIPHSFAANICRLHLPPIFCCLCLPPIFCCLCLPPTFAACICRIYLPHMFAAYILKIRLHSEQAPIFYACANIFRQAPIF